MIQQAVKRRREPQPDTDAAPTPADMAHTAAVADAARRTERAIMLLQSEVEAMRHGAPGE